MTTESENNSDKSGTRPDRGVTHHAQRTVGLDEEDTRQLQLQGQELGDYLILDELGAGGGGFVYKAQHRRMERIVALKVLRGMHNAATVQRFHREVKAAAKLLHPNIVTAFDAGEDAGLHYLVMEFVDGPSLSSLVKEQGPLSPEVCMEYVRQAAIGLDYAHSRNIVHRDIKPSNMIVDQTGTVKVLDMGLARLQGADEQAENGLTQVGIIMGTVHYMSPEQASNAAEVDYRTDIYSLGCTLFYLITGKPVYAGTMIETVLAHASKPIPSLHEHCESRIPPGLDEIYTKMMAKRVEDRWQSMAEIADAIHKLTAPPPAGSTTSRLQEMLSRVPVGDTSDALQHVVTADLGNATSLLGCMDKQDQAIILPNRLGSLVTPTAVIVEPDRIAAGEEAIQGLRLKANQVADDIKNSLGAAAYPRQLNGEEYPSLVLMSVVLKKMLDDARGKVPEPFHLALTTPGCFGDVRRHALQCAGGIASTKVVDLINEASAIAVTFLVKQGLVAQSGSRNLLVYRLGAGSFDATVIRAEGTKLTTVSVAGDPQLGCHSMDELAMKFVAQQFAAEHGVDPSQNESSQRRLRLECARLREKLSDLEQAGIQCRHEGVMLQGTLNRDSYSRLNRDILTRTKTLTIEAIEQALLNPNEIDHVILAGGGSRIPFVQSMLEGVFGEVERSMLTDDATILGATLLAARLRSSAPTPWQIREVNPASLAVVGVDRKSGKKQSTTVIPRNASLPATRRLSFRIHKDLQQAVALQLVQGDGGNLSEYSNVGHCQVELPGGLPAGTPLWLEFHLDKQARLSVMAELPNRKDPVAVPIARDGTLSDEQISQWRNWLETTLLTM